MSNGFKSVQVQALFDKNELDDLKELFAQRHRLNAYNMHLVYLFHVTQSVGIFITALATGYQWTFLVWVGVGMNILAALILAFEKTNDHMSKRLMEDIERIKTGTYTDAEDPIDPNENQKT